MEDLQQTGCADAHPRTNGVRRRVAAVLVFACLGLATAAPASGSVIVGQVPAGPPPVAMCPAGDYLQPSVTGGTLYIARQAGRITSWTTHSNGAGSYVFKVFRRTSDPDIFQVVAHSSQEALSAGLVTFPADIPVLSGDMIGFHKGGAGSSCTTPVVGDAVLQAGGDLGDGAQGGFTTLTDRRLDLSANLVPSNEFHVTQLTRNPRRGTANVVIQVPNPGAFTLTGKGLRRRRVSRTLVGGGSISFHLAAGAGAKRTLARKGAVRIGVALTFAPTNGDPSTQAIVVKLRMKRTSGRTLMR
jgi:hypothetical protein